MPQLKFKVRTKTETEAGVEVRAELVIDNTNKTLFINDIGSGQLFISNLKPEAAEEFEINQEILLPEITIS